MPFPGVSGESLNGPVPEDECPNRATLIRFLSSLSPRRDMRALARDEKTGSWSTYYEEEITVDQAAAVAGRPVVVYLTPKKGRHTDPPFTRIGCDFDAKHHSIALAANDAYLLGAYLDAAGIPYVRAISGPSGGRHVWFAVPAGVPGELVRRFAHAANLIFPTFDPLPLSNLSGYGALRPPGSPHRDGGHSVLDGVTVDEAIDRLKAGATPAQFEMLTQWLEEELPFLPQAENEHTPAGDRRPYAENDHESRKPAPSGGGLPPSVVDVHGADRVRPLETDENGHLKLPGQRRALDERARAALHTPLEPHQQHSDRMFSCVRGLVRARFSHDEGWKTAWSGMYPGLAYITTERVAGSTKRRQRSEADAQKIFIRQWMLAAEVEARRPEGHAETADPAPEVTMAVGVFLEFLSDLGPAYWSQKGRQSHLAVAFFAGLQMLAAARLDVSLGSRRCSDATGFSHETCNVALTRAVDAGHLEELDRDPKYGNRRVTLPQSLLGELLHRPAVTSEAPDTGLTQARNGRRGVLGGPSGGIEGSRSALRDHVEWLLELLASDLFAHGGRLGHHGAHTWMIMETAQGLLSLDRLIQETGFGKRTVIRHMREFSRAGLVTGDPSVGWTRTGRTLDEAAQRCSTAGIREARAARHVIDRIVWRWFQDDVEWMRLSKEEKKKARRAPAEQTCIKVDGDSSGGRRFPRRTCGSPDHSEAARLLVEELIGA